MGLSLQLAEMIALESKHKPLPDVIHTVGRLAMGFTYEEAAFVLRRAGVEPRVVKVEIDGSTIEGRNNPRPVINDRTFFGMLGVSDVAAIDISDYEGAAIIWDLCSPIPDRLANTCDFIVGGSTLDNVFSPAQYIQNIARMLRPGGRWFEVNHANDFSSPYVILTPPWYFDFFCVNMFSDCRVYVLEFAGAVVHAYKTLVPLLRNQQVGWGLIDNFEGREDITLAVVAFAEKGTESTWSEIPIQAPYRDARRVHEYGERLAALIGNPRPWLELRRTLSPPASLKRHTPPRNYHYIGHF